MTKTTSIVKRIIAIVLSAMFALTSFTITGFVPTMDAFAAGVNDYTFRVLDTEAYFKVEGSASTLPAKEVSRSTDPEWYTVDGISGAKFNTTRALTYRCAGTTLKNAGVASTFQSSSNAGDTIAFMAYTMGTGDGNPLFVIYNNDYNSSGYKTTFSMSSNGTLYYTNGSGTNSDFNATYNELKTSQGWHTYVIKLGESYSSSNKTMSFYIDGVLKKQIKSEFADDHTIDIPDSITIGCNKALSDRSSSVIRDFRFYNTKDVSVSAIDSDLRAKATVMKKTVPVRYYGIIGTQSSMSSRVNSNGTYNLVNDGQNDNTDAIVLQYDLSTIRNTLGDDYELESATYTAKVDSFNTDTTFDGIKYFYTTSTIPSGFVWSGGGYSSSRTDLITAGSGTTAPNSFVSKMGGSTSDFVRNGSNDYTVKVGSKVFTDLDITTAIKNAVEGGASYIYFIAMQNKAGGSGSTSGWTDTTIYPTAQTLTFTYKEKEGPTPIDPTEALAIINEYMPKVESLFSGMMAETNIKRYFPDLYKAYVNCNEALDEYTYTGVTDNLSPTAQNIKTIYDKYNATTWQTPYGGQKAYFQSSEAESGYYSNIIYSSSTQSDGYWTAGWNGWSEAKSKAITNKTYVMLYDGNTAPSFPVSYFAQSLTSGTFSSTKYHKFYYCTLSNSKFDLAKYTSGRYGWYGSWDTNGVAWPSSKNEVVPSTVDTSLPHSLTVTGASRYYYHFANFLQYKGTGDTTNYYEKIPGSDFQFTAGVYAGEKNESKVVIVNSTLSSDMTAYVINYKNLRQNLRNTTNIGYFKNVTDYKQGELGQLAEAYEQGMNLDPNSRFLSKTGADDSVEEWVTKTASDIKYATQNFNGIGTPQSDDKSPYPALREQLDRAKALKEKVVYTKPGVITDESKTTFETAYNNAKALMTYSKLTKGTDSVTDDYPITDVATNTTNLKNAIDGLVYNFNFTFVDSSVSPSVTTNKTIQNVGATIQKSDIETPAISKVYVNISDTQHNVFTWNVADSYTVNDNGDNSFTVNTTNQPQDCTFGEETVVPANCMEEGYKSKTCTLCNHEVRTVLPIEPDAHDFGDWHKLNDEQHQRVCSRNAAHTQEENHSYTKQPDPSDPLRVLYTCKCGDTYVGYEGSYGYWNENDQYVQLGTFAIKGKQYTSVSELIEDNMDEFTNRNIDGGLSGSHIFVTSDEYMFEVDGDKIAFYPIQCMYDTGWTQTHKDASCTEDGYDKASCSICGNEVTNVIPASGHTPVIDPEVPPTCTKDGKTEGSHCSTCNKVLVPQEPIPAPGHTWGSWQQQADKHVRECSVCHTTEEASHNFGEPTVDGLKRTYTCETCQYESVKYGKGTLTFGFNNGYGFAEVGDIQIEEEYDSIDYLIGVHAVDIIGEGINILDGKTGSHLFVTSDPDLFEFVNNDTVIFETERCDGSDSGVNYFELTSHEDPTCEVDGYDTYTCTACQNEYTDVIPAPGHTYVTKFYNNSGCYTWKDECEVCGDVRDILNELDLTGYIAELESAKSNAENAEMYTATSRALLQATIDANLIDYESFSADEVPTITQTDVDVCENAIMTDNQLVPDGVLVASQKTVIFNYVIDDGEVQTKFTKTVKYANAVSMDVNTIDPDEDYSVVKWVREIDGETSLIGSYSRNVTYIASQDAEYTVYLSSTEKSVPDSVNASMYDRIDRVREVESLVKGTYTATYDTTNDKFVMTNNSTSDSVEIDIPKFPFYNVIGFTANGVEIGYKGTATIVVNDDFNIIPKYQATNSFSFFVESGIKVSSKDATKGSEFYGYTTYNDCKWDSLITFTSDTVKDWYICYDLNDALQHPEKFVRVARGKTFKIRATKSFVIKAQNPSADDSAIAYTDYLTSCGYRTNTITSVSHYYLPEGATFVGAGVVYRTGASGKTSVNAITEEDILSGSEVKGRFDASVFVGDTNQYTINYHSTAVTSGLKVAARSYLIYSDNSGTHVAFSDAVTFNY